MEIQYFIWMLVHLSSFSFKDLSSALYVLRTSITASLPNKLPYFLKEPAEIIKTHPSPPPVFKNISEMEAYTFIRLSLYKNVQWLYWHVHSIMFTAARYEAHSVLHFIKISGSNITQKFKWNCCCNLIILIQDKHWYLYIQRDTCYVYAFLTQFYFL